MQSELASHIGLKGNLFCRICTVHGNVTSDDGETEGNHAGEEPDQETAGESASEGEQPKKVHNKKSETMAEMVNRITRFASVRH